jgi:DNA end-binding protein Ku
MARPIWSGAISFGLVTVPVKLFSATESKQVSFNQFQEGTGQRIRYKRVAEESGEEVSYSDIVKGYEVEKGRYVIVTPEELEGVEPRKSRTIEIEDFVDLDEIDPVYFDKTYYLGPAGDVGAEKPYALLHRALKGARKVAVARFVMRTKEYLAVIRPVGELLGLETMYFPDEVRGADQVEGAPVEVELSERELAIAEQLIDSMTDTWQPDRYEDTYRVRVLELIEAKAKGEEVLTESEAAPAPVGDLMAALEASVARARERKSGGAQPSIGAPSAAEADADADADATVEAGKADGEVDLSTLNKDELYDRAAAASVPGRSKMTKEELVDALRKTA